MTATADYSDGKVYFIIIIIIITANGQSGQDGKHLFGATSIRHSLIQTTGAFWRALTF